MAFTVISALPTSDPECDNPCDNCGLEVGSTATGPPRPQKQEACQDEGEWTLQRSSVSLKKRKKKKKHSEDIEDVGLDAMRAALAATAATEPESHSKLADNFWEEHEPQLQQLQQPEHPEQREHVNLVFIGHAEAGKSALCSATLRTGPTAAGREVLTAALAGVPEGERRQMVGEWLFPLVRGKWQLTNPAKVTGMLLELEMADLLECLYSPQVLQEAVAAALQTLGAPPPRARLGRDVFHSNQKRYTVLDVPGTKDDVPAMIEGACHADVGVLVISAREGEFETGFERGGQTREHAMLAKTLGVTKLLVAINKLDAAYTELDETVAYAMQRYDACVDTLTPFLKGCGFNVASDVSFLPVAALAAVNVLERSVKLPWHSGPTLLEALDALPPFERNPDSPLRLTIRSQHTGTGTDRGLGTIIEGKVEQGTIKPGDKLWMMPNRVPVEVLNVWRDQVEVTSLGAGENARINLKCTSTDRMRPGSVLSPRGALACPAVRRFEVQLAIVELPAHKPSLSAGYKATLYVHSIATACSVVKITAKVNPSTGQPINPPPEPHACVGAGAVIACIVETEQEICIEQFDACPRFGRFTLRDGGLTIGIGKILDLSQDAERIETGTTEDDTGSESDSDIEIPRALSDL